MNPIQLRDKIDFYNDRVRSARFEDYQYATAWNDALMQTTDDRIGNKKINRGYSLQSEQQIRDDLYTLIKEATIVPVSDVVAFPADYYFTVRLRATINSVSRTSVPTDYNTLGTLEEDPFSRPSAVKPYHNETSTGLKVHYGSGTFSSSILTYIKKPQKISFGKESQKISAGSGVITAGQNYTCYEQSNHNNVIYYPGDTFNAVNNNLIDGVVILTSNLTSPDIPDKLQDEVCKRAAAILQKTVDNLNKSNGIDQEIERT